MDEILNRADGLSNAAVRGKIACSPGKRVPAVTRSDRSHSEGKDRSLEETELGLRDDLRGLTAGDVHVDALSRAAYSCDASILQVRPAAVVAPKSPEEISAILAYAASHSLGVHARGAGTGLAGESLGSGIVVDVSRYLNRILATGDTWVRVEPGVRLAPLQQHLAARGRMVAVDPISADRCTVGGMVATNAAGPHSLRYGAIRDHVLSCHGVLSDGTSVELQRVSLDARDDANSGPLDALIRALSRVLSANSTAIQEEQPASLLKHGGYELRGVLEGRTIHLPRLLAGSEGTLAFLTEIELATVPIPAYRGMLLATFPTLQAAADAVVETLEYQPTACEMLDRRLLSLVRETEPWYREWVSEDAEALLLIEHEGSSADNVVERIVLNQNRLNRVKRLASQTREVYGEPNLSLCWRIRDQAMPRLTRSHDNIQPIPFVENTAVPPQSLPEFLAKVQNVMKRHGVTATYSAHAGVGILHTRPLLDVHFTRDREKLEPIAQDMLDAVLSCGGTFNGEHGVGPLRGGFLPRQYPRLYPVFRRIKSIFDPKNILNPGRMVGLDFVFPDHLLRPAAKVKEAGATDSLPTTVASRTRDAAVQTQLRWPELSVVAMAQRCNGCASCQTTHSSSRMCPIYRARGNELAGPRTMANLIRQALNEELDGVTIGSPDFRAIAESCINCKMCRVECPSAVDVSKLMLEAKATSAADEGLSRADWFFANWDAFVRRASLQDHFANALLANPVVRWFLERTFGLARNRRLLRFTHRNFLRIAQRAGWSRKPTSRRTREKVALFVDAYTNYQDPWLAECAVGLLERLGIAVFVPPLQRTSGMHFLQYGDVETARARVLWNFEIAVELVREGYQILATEPSAALMLRMEACNLVSDTDLETVAAATFEVSEFLAQRQQTKGMGLRLDEIPLAVGYHEPCHERALGLRASPADLLRSIPSLRVFEVELGCSGMGETFGLREDGFALSLRAGAAMLGRMAAADIHACATQCGACRTQIEQAARKPTLHPVKLLGIAAGLSAQPRKLLKTPNRGLVSQ